MTNNYFKVPLFRCSALIFMLLGSVKAQAYAQPNVDSLKQILETAVNDSLRAETYYALSTAIGDYDMGGAIAYLQDCLNLLERSGTDVKSIARAENSLGILYYNLGDVENTLKYFYKVLAFYENQEVKDPDNLSSMYNNVGLVLLDFDRSEEAIDYFNKSIDLKLNLNDPRGMANVYNNVGLAHQKTKNYELARSYFNKAFNIDKQFNDAEGMLSTNISIGKNFYEQQQYDSTSIYYQRAAMLMDQVDDLNSKSGLLLDFGDLNMKQGKYNRAIEKYLTGLEWSTSMNSLSLIQRSYNGLAKGYQALDQHERAFEYFEKYDSIKDLLYSEQQAKNMADIETNYRVQKVKRENELLLKEAEITDLKLANNKAALYFLIGAIFLVGLVVYLLYRKNVYKSRTNHLLKEQNSEIIKKNKNIMDSILYAKNIQEAILPEHKKIQGVFQEAFVFSKARDVVSGDFYWFAEKGDKIIIAAVDCTGHGVPAAFLNVLGNTQLNQIVEEQNIIEPAAILQEMNRRVLTSLKNEKVHRTADDGMDMGICLFDRSRNSLSFAGAKRPLYYYHNHELNILKGDHYPVGGSLYEEERTFRQHELALHTDDTIYLFTDGIVDQFGGKDNKKFMYNRLKGLIQEIIEKPMEYQQEAIEKTLREWQGNNEQTDDILLIGVKV